MEKFYENYSIKIPPEDIPNAGGQEAESRISNSGFLDKMLNAPEYQESLLYELLKIKEENRRLKGENERLTRESAKDKAESLGINPRSIERWLPKFIRSKMAMQKSKGVYLKCNP